MVELMLPKADRPTKGKTWPKPANAKRVREYHVYRYDPDQDAIRASTPISSTSTIAVR